jgi:hypothetical protein
MWHGNRPLPRPCKVVAIGARIKVVLLERDGEMSSSYKLLQKHEVLAVFDSKESGIKFCSAAAELWDKCNLEIRELERKRDADVLLMLRGEAA